MHTYWQLPSASDMYFLDAVASREAASSNVFPSSFSFSPFQYNCIRYPVLHTKEGISTVGSICWNVSLHYWFHLSRTFNTIILDLWYINYWKAEQKYCRDCV